MQRACPPVLLPHPHQTRGPMLRVMQAVLEATPGQRIWVAGGTSAQPGSLTPRARGPPGSLLTPPAVGALGALIVKGFSKRTDIHRRFPSVHSELLFSSSSQSLEGLGVPGPGGHPCSLGLSRPSPRLRTDLPPSLALAALGPGEGAGPRQKRAQARGHLKVCGMLSHCGQGQQS